MLVAFLLVAHPAEAANCVAADWPGGTSQSCRSVCTYHTVGGNDYITCDLTANGDSTGGIIHSATSYGSSANDFSFWGSDASGAAFCCAYTESGEVDQVTLTGGAHADSLYLSDGTFMGASLTHNGGTQPFDILIYAEGGDDTVRGAQSLNTTYASQTLRGGDDDDDIRCNETCIAWGEDGDDTIVGSEDPDVLYGDDFNTASGDDAISGGSGADEIWGEDGIDTICGDTGNDDIHGGWGADVLWGGDGTSDYIDGYADDDECSAETEVSCEYTLASEPATCP